MKNIAKGKGETQLTLSLCDAIYAAESINDINTLRALTDIVEKHSQQFTDASLNILIGKAIDMGNRISGTRGGNQISTQLFELVRKCGDRISKKTVQKLVIRDGSYSRVGMTALGILYDDYFDHIESLDLPLYFVKIEPSVAYYCAYRKAFPGDMSSVSDGYPSGFTFAGLFSKRSENALDKYINRGPSALLDDLCGVD